MIGGEFSGVPGDASNCDPKLNNCNDGLRGPTGSPDDGNAGPGMRPASESINMIVSGWPDIPDCPGPDKMGYRFRLGVQWQFGSSPATTGDEVNPFKFIDDIPRTVPSELNLLYPWKREFRPSGIDVYADFKQDGSFEYHEHYKLAIPWTVVHMHLLGITYQADHHPQIGCGFLGPSREMVWRNVTVGPLRYKSTSVAPRGSRSISPRGVKT